MEDSVGLVASFVEIVSRNDIFWRKICDTYHWLCFLCVFRVFPFISGCMCISIAMEVLYSYRLYQTRTWLLRVFLGDESRKPSYVGIISSTMIRIPIE